MRNLYKPTRYNVASIQAQQTLGGDVMQSHEEGQYVEWRDYQWLLTEKQRLDNENARLKAEVERFTKAIMDSVEMRQRLREIEEGKQS